MRSGSFALGPDVGGPENDGGPSWLVIIVGVIIVVKWIGELCQ